MFLELVSDAQGCVIVILVLTVVQFILFEGFNKMAIRYFRSRPWWPQAAPLQKALMMNFGYPEEDCTDDAIIDGYCFVIVFASHHFMAGLAMLPVVISGWEAAGSTGQSMFLFACLADVALDIDDWIKRFALAFFPGTFSFLGPPCPVIAFVIICVLHHSLAMCMIVPLILNYPSLRSFHLIAISLLLAAGICFTTGSYKFTLDVMSKGGFLQYKAIVLVQLVTILFTRGYVWFTEVYAALTFFHAEGAMKFFYGGCVAAGMMSLFNLIMIMDAAGAAAKWLPKSMPENEEEEEELSIAMVKRQSSVALFGGDSLISAPTIDKLTSLRSMKTLSKPILT